MLKIIILYLCDNICLLKSTELKKIYYEMISNYMISLEKIAAIAAGLVYSDNMTEFKIYGKCNMRKKII